MHVKKTFSTYMSILILTSILLACFFPTYTASALVREPRLNLRYLSAARHTSYKLNVYNMLQEQTVDFSSSNTGVVAIKKVKSRSCRLKTKASGTATVTAEISDADDNIVSVLKCKVTVSPSAVSIKFPKHKVKIPKGETKTVKAIIKPNISAEQPRYISDDPDIATVSSTGTVTAISEGRTTIRAFISNRKETAYTVIVISGDNNNNNDDDKQTEEPEKHTAEPVPSPSPSDYYSTKSIIYPDGEGEYSPIYDTYN